MYQKTLTMPVDGLYLEADLSMPVKSDSIIIFSGFASRYGPLQNRMARYLNNSGFGTVLFNLLTSEEAEHIDRAPTIELVTERLLAFTLWIKSHSEFQGFDLGYFGFNIGAAATLRAASELDSTIKAMVTVSARTDLAAAYLRKLLTPTLLIVGELDFRALELNRNAIKKVQGDKQMLVIPGASHSLEEPGKLEMAARDAAEWYSKYMKSSTKIQKLQQLS